MLTPILCITTEFDPVVWLIWFVTQGTRKTRYKKNYRECKKLEVKWHCSSFWHLCPEPVSTSGTSAFCEDPSGAFSFPFLSWRSPVGASILPKPSTDCGLCPSSKTGVRNWHPPTDNRVYCWAKDTSFIHWAARLQQSVVDERVGRTWVWVVFY